MRHIDLINDRRTLSLFLTGIFVWVCLSHVASAQSMRERSPSQPEPTWVRPAGHSINQSTQQTESVPQSTTLPSGQRVFNALPPPDAPRTNAPRTATNPVQIPNRMTAPSSFSEGAGTKSEVVQASYSEVPASMNLGASTTNSRGPLELRPSSKDKSGSVDRPKSSSGTIVSVFLSLAVVLSFFLLVAWLIKKSQPRSFLKLPGDVVQVMGRTPMAPRQQMYVVRFGSKLLLISHQPGQTQTLGEITDADEVQRLAGLCEANHPGSISNSFRDVLKQVTMGKTEPEPRQTTRLSRGRA